MFSLTEQERKVATFIGLVISFGVLVKFSFRLKWQTAAVFHVLDDPSFYPRTDINKASLEALQALPRMDAALARAIIDYRKAHGAFKDINDLKDVMPLRPYQIKRLSQYLKVR